MTINPDIFDGAADRIFQYGLNKGDYYKGNDGDDREWPYEIGEFVRENNPRCCVLGAIAAEGVDLLEQDILAYANFLAETLGLRGSWDVPDWNDADHRRRADVVKALRRAADRARQEK